MPKVGLTILPIPLLNQLDRKKFKKEKALGNQGLTTDLGGIFWLIYYKSVALPTELYRRISLRAATTFVFRATDFLRVGLLITPVYPNPNQLLSS